MVSTVVSIADGQPVSRVTGLLGEWLISEGYITQAQLDDALLCQQKSGAKLGEILTHQGALPTITLYQALAHQHEMPFINVLHAMPDQAVIDTRRAQDYVRAGLLPIRKDADGRIIVASTTPVPDKAMMRVIAGDCPYIVHITSPLDIAWAVQHTCHDRLTDIACEGLRYAFPSESLRSQHTGAGNVATLATAASMIAACIMWPVLSAYIAVVGVTVFFVSTLLFKVVLMLIGIAKRDAVFELSNVALLDDAQCPIYTVLIPIYREAESVPDLLQALCALDYPASKMDVKLLVEQDDSATRQAIKDTSSDARFHLITVPECAPKTKPKACNYGMQFARGEYVTIFDAEDAPHPGQLRLAASIFHAYPDVACLQACLQYYNAAQNWLTWLFAVEYRGLFHYLLPALYVLNIPIPLGGTSNHIRREALEALGMWDAYNVTEDADLGIRLCAHGYRILPIDSYTLEEAPLSVGTWIKQRSRWIKGYIQTWMVLNRNTKKRRIQLGWRAFIGVHYFIGAASLVYILAPLCWAVVLLWALAPAVHVALPDWIQLLCIASLVGGILTQWICAGAIMWHCRALRHIGVMFTFPCYFMLHTIASVKSLWQLLVNPYYWEKTTHGVSHIKRNAAMQAGLSETD